MPEVWEMSPSQTLLKFVYEFEYESTVNIFEFNISVNLGWDGNKNDIYVKSIH